VKMGILLASVLSGLVGALTLFLVSQRASARLHAEADAT